MSLKKKIFIRLIAAAVVIVIWNISFPRIYTKIKYPDAEFVSSRTRNGSIYNGIMTPPDFGYRYATFFLYDALTDISFNQEFELVWYFPFYYPVRSNFESLYETKKNFNTALYNMERITKWHSEEYVIASGSPYADYEFRIFLKRTETEKLAALIEELDDYIERKSPTSINPNGYYISYLLYVCMDDEFYGKYAAEDNLNGFAYVPNIEYFRITASYNGFSAKIYENPGDPTYKGISDEYQDPDSFDHLVFYYESEPNMVRHQSQHFYLFGVNEKE